MERNLNPTFPLHFSKLEEARRAPPPMMGFYGVRLSHNQQPILKGYAQDQVNQKGIDFPVENSTLTLRVSNSRLKGLRLADSRGKGELTEPMRN